MLKLEIIHHFYSRMKLINMKVFFGFVDENMKSSSEWGHKHLQPQHKTIIENYHYKSTSEQCHWYIILDAKKIFVTNPSLGILLEISYLTILLTIAGNLRSTRSAIL